MTTFIDVDVRPILRSGRDPFSAIMSALDIINPGEGLRLFATFKPIPLFALMESRGFSHAARELKDGEWEVCFAPCDVADASVPLDAVSSAFDNWPEPTISLDNRDLEPPEPMVRILAAAEKLEAGQTLSALLGREPGFLFPQLEKRGFRWLGGFTADGTIYELTVKAPS